MGSSDRRLVVVVEDERTSQHSHGCYLIVHMTLSLITFTTVARSYGCSWPVSAVCHLTLFATVLTGCPSWGMPSFPLVGRHVIHHVNPRVYSSQLLTHPRPLPLSCRIPIVQVCHSLHPLRCDLAAWMASWVFVTVRAVCTRFHSNDNPEGCLLTGGAVVPTCLA